MDVIFFILIKSVFPLVFIGAIIFYSIKNLIHLMKKNYFALKKGARNLFYILSFILHTHFTLFYVAIIARDVNFLSTSFTIYAVLSLIVSFLLVYLTHKSYHKNRKLFLTLVILQLIYFVVGLTIVFMMVDTGPVGIQVNP